MLTIAIRETNSHFTHGIKIIVANVCHRLKKDFCFLSPEHHHCADIVFLSLDDNWVTAECYQMPKATKSQRIILICRRKEHQNLMFRPCLYMLPVIFREDEIDEITRKIAYWIEPARHGKNTVAIPAGICQYCTTRSFTVVERQLLSHIAEGHSLKDSASLMKLDENIAKLHRKAIMRKLGIRDQYELHKFLKANLLFLLHN